MNPLAAPLAALIAGIVVAPILDQRSVWVALPIAVTVASIRPKLLLIAIFLVGASTRSMAEAPPPRLPDDGYAARVVGRIVSGPEQRREGYRLKISVESANGTAVGGNALVDYFPEDNDLAAMFREIGLSSGDRIEILVRLRPPAVYRNPGGFDYGRFLERQGIYWTGTLRNPRLVYVLERGEDIRGAFRRELAERISGALGSDAVVQSLALGMVLGQRDTLDPEATRRFEQAGLIHLLVVSGFNLAVVAMAGLWLGRRIPFRRWRRGLGLTFALLVVLAYASVVEGDAPVVRATIMAGLLIVGTMLDRGYRLRTALTTSAFLILLFDPLAVENSGFLMTSVAVLAIDGLAIPLIRWVRDAAGRPLSIYSRPRDVAMDARLPIRATDRRVIHRLRSERSGLPLWIHTGGERISWLAIDVLLVTLAVQGALLPLTVEAYHRVSLIALPLNVLGAMTASVVTPLGLVIAVLPAPLAGIPAIAVTGTLRLLVAAVDLGLRWPGAVLTVPSPPLAVWVAFTTTLVWLSFALSRRRRVHAIAAGMVAAALVVTVTVADFSPPPPHVPTITVLDVGQGDSILIELPAGDRILIDGGGSTMRPSAGETRDAGQARGFSIGEDVVVPYLLSRGIRQLDAVVLSHAHQDHMNGLVDVLGNMSVREVWLGPNPPVPGFTRLLDAAARSGVPIRWLSRGDTIGAFRILHPPPDHSVGESADNDDSLVLLLETPFGSALFSGDIETDLPDAPEWVTVLKVPHHGSRNAANNLRGSLRVISAGARNPFGHPHPSRLPALRTDLQGAIRIELLPEGPRATFPGL